VPGLKARGDVASHRSPPFAAEVVGQWHAKRALIIAAAGSHSMLLMGRPAAARACWRRGCLNCCRRSRPVRHSMSRASPRRPACVWTRASGARVRFAARIIRPRAQAIVGGGPQIRPGEVTLAHHGVLFLDELPEYDRRVLESLREPLETGAITIARAAARLELPARFQLIAAMNPCPCGYFGDSARACLCGASRVARYRQRISGPLLDRIDLRIEVAANRGRRICRRSAARGRRTCERGLTGKCSGAGRACARVAIASIRMFKRAARHSGAAELLCIAAIGPSNC